MRILANDGITAKGKQMLEEAGYTVSTKQIEQQNLASVINEENYEILLVRSATKVRQDLIDECPGLKAIGRGGVGTDNIDVEYAESLGKYVFNTPESSSDSVAELVIGQMFAISRSLHVLNEKMPYESFNVLKKSYSNGVELRGKTIGIVGFGRIGRSLAGYALGLGMNVLAVDIEERTTTVSVNVGGKTVEVEINVESDLEKVLPNCDFVSVHVPLQENGDSAITMNELSMLKYGAVIINAARGNVIDEEDLLISLRIGTVSAAALDVFDNEPLPKASILEHERIFCTPHVGAATQEAQLRIGQELAEKIIARYGVMSQLTQ